MDRRQSDALRQLAAALQEMCDSGLSDDEGLNNIINRQFREHPNGCDTLQAFYQGVILFEEQLRQPMGSSLTLRMAVSHGLTKQELNDLEASDQLHNTLWDLFKEQADQAAGCNMLEFDEIEHYQTGENPEAEIRGYVVSRQKGDEISRLSDWLQRKGWEESMADDIARCYERVSIEESLSYSDGRHFLQGKRFSEQQIDEAFDHVNEWRVASGRETL